MDMDNDKANGFGMQRPFNPALPEGMMRAHLASPLPIRMSEEVRRFRGDLGDEKSAPRRMVHQPGVGEREATTLEDALLNLETRADRLAELALHSLERMVGAQPTEDVKASDQNSPPPVLDRLNAIGDKMNLALHRAMTLARHV